MFVQVGIEDNLLVTGYIWWHILSLIATLGIGVWVYYRTETAGRLTFVAVMAIDFVWMVAATIEILTSGPVALAATYANELAGLLSVGCWFVFTLQFTGRSVSIRQPTNAIIGLGLMIAIAGLLTNPFYGWFWTAVEQEGLFTFYRTEVGPLGVVGILVAFGTILSGLYYVSLYFLRSNHRSSDTAVTFIVAVVGSLLPFVLSNLGYFPVEGWDHTSMGVLPFVAAVAFGIFWRGALDIAPIARKRVFEVTEDGIVILDADHLIVDYNNAAAGISSVRSDGMLESNQFGEAFPAFAEAFPNPSDKEGDNGERIVSRPERGDYYSIRVSPLEDHGELTGYAVMLREVTDLVRQQRKLEDQNEKLDRFTSAVAHDLRNPLNVAIGRAEMIRSDSDSDHHVALDRAHRRMENMIEDILTLAREDDTVSENALIDISDLCAECWSTVDTKRASLEVTIHHPIYADEQRLKRLFENLFRNAIDHGGDDVSITIGQLPDGFYVEDNGPGIPVEEREIVFEQGYSTIGSGTGFGLSIVKQVVEAHGWEVSVTDGTEGGARFEFIGVLFDDR